MNENPLVTVIIPSYNHEKWIANAIESVLNQTYKNIELIIIDDGSTDKSRDVISKYLADNRVKAVFNESNKGQGRSLNMAIDMSNGEYISILPSDDWYLPDKTKLQVDLFESIPQSFGLVYGHGLRFYEDSGETKPVILPAYRGNVLIKLIEDGNFVYPASPMIRKSVFSDIRFNETYKAEGEAIFVRIAEKFEFDYVDCDVVVMRAHTYNTGSSHEMMYQDNIRWWNEYFELKTTPDHVMHLKNKIIGRLHRMYGLTLLTERNDMFKSRVALFKSLKMQSRYLFDLKVVIGILLTYFPEILSKKIVNAKNKKRI